MRSGKLRHKIEIQEKLILRSPTGEERVTWTTFAYAFASVEPLSGREYFAAQQTQASVSHKIKMRYQSGIRPHHHIQWGGRFFNIDAVLNEEERNIALTLYCTEVI